MKFYKSVVTITIVDTVPLEWNSLRDIYDAANDALMSIAEITPVEITGKEAADFAIANDSDPEWLGIDEEGKEVDV